MEANRHLPANIVALSKDSRRGKLKYLVQQFKMKFHLMPSIRHPLSVFEVVAFLAISASIYWFYSQNLRGDGEPLSLTAFNVLIALCSIIAARIIVWRNPDSVWWIVAIFTVLFVSIFLTGTYWDDLTGGTESLSTTLRNIGLLTGGCVAMLLAVWRSMVGERQANTALQQANTALQQANTALQQANTARNQAETMQFSALNDRYERANQSLSSDMPWVRLGGIYALQRIAEEYPEQYHVQVMQLLCAFVRKPIDMEPTVMPTAGPLRDDIQNAMTAIVRRDEKRIQLEEKSDFQIDLRSADLRRVMLRGANLSNANLDNANLSEATLIGADLSCVRLWCTNLSGVLFAEPSNEEGNNACRNPVQGLTQQILNDACADADKPPRGLCYARDASTGEPLHWCGHIC